MPEPVFTSFLIIHCYQTRVHELQEPLALQIPSGDYREGDAILMDRDGDALIFSTAVQGEAVEA